MLISVSKGFKYFDPLEVHSFSDLTHAILSYNYSFGVFTDGHRHLDNFQSAEAIGLDFDAGLSLAEAKAQFAPYRHIIAVSRNHQKVKHPGEPSELPACDRFRVILFLSRPITSRAEYAATWDTLARRYPDADPQCKDASRMFFPSPSIASVSKDGLRVDPVDAIQDTIQASNAALKGSGTYGSLGVSTMRFLTEGAAPGEWNGALYKAARDMYQQGISQEEALTRLRAMVNPFYSGHLDSKDLTTIDSAYSKEPKHEARVPETSFRLRKWTDVNAEKLDKVWVVDKLMSQGGVTVLGADPKAGKTTLVRQLAASVLRGTPFLTRDVTPGPVVWYALEEQVEDIQYGFRKLGVKPDDELYIHVGPPMTDQTVEDLSTNLFMLKPSLVVIDTLFDMLQVENENSYNLVRQQMARFSNVARATGSHIVFIHHTNKGGAAKDGQAFQRRGTRAMMGSTAVLSKPDTLMVMEQQESKRFITVKGRGTVSWFYRELLYDADSMTYSLGREEEF